MNNYFREENGQIFVWDTYSWFRPEDVSIPNTVIRAGTIKEVNPSVGDFVWLPEQNLFSDECWDKVDEGFLKFYSSSFLKNYRFVFSIKIKP